MKTRRIQTSLIAVLCLCLILTGSFLLARQGGVTPALQSGGEIRHSLRNDPSVEDEPLSHFEAVFYANDTLFHSDSNITGEAVVFPAADPEKSGYVFAGWALDGSIVISAVFADSGLTLTATWNKLHTASFLSDGEPVSSASGVDGAAVTFPAADPEKSGYVFAGWTLDGSLVTEVVFADADGDLTITATWHKLYTASFLSDGDTVSSVSGLDGAAVTFPANPVKDGYVFAGWDLDGSIVTEAVFADTDLIFTAVWHKLHTASFLSQEALFARSKGVDGAAVTFPATSPEKAGYDFAGWALDGSIVNEAVFADKDGDLTFAASWTARTDTPYTVLHLGQSVDGAAFDVTLQSENKQGTTDSVLSAEALQGDFTGFAFDGAQSADSSIAGDGSTVLTVYYTRKQYTILFQDELNPAITASFSVYYEAAIPTPSLSQEGYELVQWKYLDAPLALDALGTLDTVGERTYYTVFKAIHSATFQFGAETGNKTVVRKGIQGNKIDFPAGDEIPERPGYTLLSWTMGASETPADADNTFFPDSPVTFIAHWTANTDTAYTVRHIGQQLNGAAYTMPLRSEETKHGTTDTQSASAEALQQTFSGFYYDSAVNTEQSVNVDGNGNAILTVYYTRKSFDILFIDPADDNYRVTINLRYEADILPPAALPTREGYELFGWAYGANPPAQSLGTLGTEGDRTYSAHWNKLYQIDFQYGLDGVENPAPFYGVLGADIVFPADMLTVKPGYKPVWNPSITKINANTTLTASWAKRSDLKYQVQIFTENTTGGYNGATPETQDFANGLFEEKFTAAALAGALSTGFELDDAMNPADEDGYVVSADDSQVFCVYIKRLRFTLTFQRSMEQQNKTDGTLDTQPVATKQELFGATIQAPSKPTLMTGYNAYGAWEAEDGPALAAGDTMPNKEMTFTCTTLLKRCTVQFSLNGSVIKTSVYKYGDDLNNPDKMPGYTHKADYNFQNWDVSGTAKSDLHLDAWETVNYTVEIYAMNTSGAYPATPTKTEVRTDGIVGSKLTLETPSTYSGAGWRVDDSVKDKDGNSKNKLSVAKLPRPEDEKVTLTVYYARNKFKLTTLTWGNKSAAKEYFFGQTIPAPAAPHTEDMTFTGWDPALPKTMPAQHMTLVAQYRAKKLVSFIVTGAPAQTTVKQVFNLNNTKLQCTYDNGDYAQTTVVVKQDLINSGAVTYTPKSFDSAGTKTVTVSYGGKTAKFQIYVAARLPQTVTVKEPILKPGFKVGTTPTWDGYYALVQYNNHTETSYKLTDSKVKISGYQKDKTGIQTITVTYTEGKLTPIKTTFTINVVADKKIVKGDVNGDGYITSTDMTLVRKHYMKIALLKGDALKAADVNGDGYITSTDMTLIRKHYMKIQLIK